MILFIISSSPKPTCLEVNGLQFKGRMVCVKGGKANRKPLCIVSNYPHEKKK